MPRAMLIAIYGAILALSWLLTRKLRKRWYSRGSIEIVLVCVVLGIAVVSAVGAWYESTHIDRGEFD